jgi:N-acetylglucosaminyltransferase
MPVTTIAVTVALPMYLAIVPVYSGLQRRYAGRAGLRRPVPQPGRFRPDVDVIVPCYNEEPALLAACLRSLARQDYKGRLRVWVVDDGSDNLHALRPVLEAETGLGQRVLLLERNRGKREAQAAALRQGRGEVVVTIDSDTTIAPDGIGRLVAWLHDPKVGAVTGNLRASNAEATWLTRLIDTRYRLLFERERAAQGWFGAVLCCAGPFSAYRRTAVEEVLDDYLGQRFWGGHRVCGDDLKLTNLVLAHGYRSEFEPAAKAATDVPTTLPRFVRQQLRWNRSFYRELPRMLRLLPGRSLYLALDLASRTLLPVLSAVVVAATAVDGLFDPSGVLVGLGALALMGLATLPLGPTLSTTAGRRFAIGYSLVFVGLLLPTRLWAACTLFRNCWGTRERRDYRRIWSRSLRALASAISLPFCLYRRIARSSSRPASP